MKNLGTYLMVVPAVTWLLGWLTAGLWAASQGYAGHDMGPLATNLFFGTLILAIWLAVAGGFLTWWSSR